ncbi:MAG: hypothetical protein U9Q08_04110 [Candidatus Omnitrophota bacterium]|nr:hypothetical protein [Candidatus Omnitrophota bacterium]
MAKTKKQTTAQKEAKKILGYTKKNLLKFSKDTLKLAKKAEKEIVRVSKVGKLHLDILGLKRKKETLCQQIGEKIVEMDALGKVNLPEIKPTCTKIRGLDNQIKKTRTKAEDIKRKK